MPLVAVEDVVPDRICLVADDDALGIDAGLEQGERHKRLDRRA
jgi:hypothetical protein